MLCLYAKIKYSTKTPEIISTHWDRGAYHRERVTEEEEECAAEALRTNADNIEFFVDSME